MSSLWMKKIIGVLAYSILLMQPVQASTDFRFEEVYDAPFWRNGWVVGGAITAVSIGAAVFTTVTAGTGAPAAAFGVSSVASALAGGGAGSYMAGLSILGSWVGGNAIIGAAILNAGSAALIGGTALKGLSTVTIVSLVAMETLGPMLIVQNKENKEINFVVSIQPTTDIGSDQVTDLVSRIKDISEQLKDKEITDNQAAQKQKEIAAEALNIVLRNAGMTAPEKVEDRISALILIRNFGYINEFIAHTKTLPEIGDKPSFIYYMKSVAYLDEQNFAQAEHYAHLAMMAEEEAIEPVIIRIMALNGLGKYQQAVGLEGAIEEFDDDHYNTQISKATAYNVLGDYASFRKDYSTAANFYTKSFDNTRYADPDEVKALLCAKAANAYRLSSDQDNANKYYKKAIDYAEDADKPNDVLQAVTKMYSSEG